MAKQEKKSKIALVGYRLAGGGLERVLSTVSTLLHDADCEIHVIILEDEIEFPHSGTLLNLGKYSKFTKYFKLRNYLKTNDVEFVIDFRHRINPWMELTFLHYIYAGFKTIYTVHTSILNHHFTDIKWITKQIFTKAYKIVSVSTEMNGKIKREYHFQNGVVIPNCISENFVESDILVEKLPYKYCIAAGRLVKMKQFDKLIETYCKSDLSSQGLHLVIVGDGEEKIALKNQIQSSGMTEFIHLLGFQSQPLFYIQNAEFLVLTSEYEGFGMVILEALSVGIPAVSFDCETGPNEMIINEHNGLLVENQNFDELELALNEMTTDQNLYIFCKKNAKSTVAKFSPEVIREKWLDLLNNNTK